MLCTSMSSIFSSPFLCEENKKQKFNFALNVQSRIECVQPYNSAAQLATSQATAAESRAALAEAESARAAAVASSERCQEDLRRAEAAAADAREALSSVRIDDTIGAHSPRSILCC